MKCPDCRGNNTRIVGEGGSYWIVRCERRRCGNVYRVEKEIKGEVEETTFGQCE